MKSPNNCPFLIFTDQAELLAAEQLPARSRTGNIKSVFTIYAASCPPKWDAFVLADGRKTRDYTRLIVHQLEKQLPR